MAERLFPFPSRFKLSFASGRIDPMTGSAKSLLVLGTSSHAGKSLVTAGLCRLIRRRGISVAPFKAQNMSLNSFVTAAGGEMGRAQVVQADACRIDPEVAMNPILLKPSGPNSVQVILRGEVYGNMTAHRAAATSAWRVGRLFSDHIEDNRPARPDLTEAFNPGRTTGVLRIGFSGLKIAKFKDQACV